MRRIRYAVAMSLDGYIAGPHGEADWIIMDPDIDFAAITSEFATIVVGGRTYTAMTQGTTAGPIFGMKTLVFSRTLNQADYPKVTIVAENAEAVLDAIRAEPGKDIWLFGGGLLFRSLVEMGQVDTVELAVVPVLLGQGIPMFPAPAKQTGLKLTNHRLYPKTGIVLLEYEIEKRARA